MLSPWPFTQTSIYKYQGQPWESKDSAGNTFYLVYSSSESIKAKTFFKLQKVITQRVIKTHYCFHIYKTLAEFWLQKGKVLTLEKKKAKNSITHSLNKYAYCFDIYTNTSCNSSNSKARSRLVILIVSSKFAFMHTCLKSIKMRPYYQCD